MNLFGIRSSKEGKNITLDKINRSIRKYIRNKKIDIKIIQTHKESKIVSYLHANRNNFDGIILTPGPWQNSGYILQDTLNIIGHDYVVIKITQDESINLLSGSKNIFNDDIYKSFEEALDYYVSK
jgi:3-dehydroquinate dehydratase